MRWCALVFLSIWECVDAAVPVHRWVGAPAIGARGFLWPCVLRELLVLVGDADVGGRARVGAAAAEFAVCVVGPGREVVGRVAAGAAASPDTGRGEQVGARVAGLLGAGRARAFVVVVPE